ncbi:hypothetical protein BOX15_Mlig015968g1 [Macrostomum lignano]|uniref:Uncharacterized protein n=2 Tax=Macrostomum lignano TaxID=282301 RepID=A0A267H6M8_9PLAT|nr:hypothetical protein BOX15_Mlig015968g1 [Macrostomum lignano]
MPDIDVFICLSNSCQAANNLAFSTNLSIFLINGLYASTAMASSRARGQFVSGPLDERHLKHLLQHEYSVTGTSIVEPLLQRFWRALIDWVPMNAAPNALTLAGLMMNASSAVLLLIYSPDAKQDIPAWLLLYAAFALFVYQTLDALDGKQARRTGSANQLGELFDHGCDAANTLLVTLSLSVATGLGHTPKLMLVQCASSMTLFFVAHWIAYITGKIMFGMFDVTEAQLCCMGVFIATAFGGVNGLWGVSVLPGGILMRHVQVLVYLTTSSSLYFRLAYCISQGGAGKNGSTVANTSIIFPGVVWLMLIVITAAVSNKSPSLFLDRPCLFITAFGAASVKICERLIVAHMTRTELALWDSGLLGPALLVVNQYFNEPLSEGVALYLATIIGLADVVQYSARLCRQIASYLGVQVLTINGNNSGGGSDRNLRPRKSH